MTRRIFKVISALLLIAIPTYIVVKNRELVSVYAASDAPFTVSVGVLVLITFISGVLCTALVASLLGISSWWERRKLRKRDNLSVLLLKTLEEARSASAAHEWNRAKGLWQDLLRQDPLNVIARIELSRVHQLCGEPKEGLKILEGVRAQHPDNAEVLFQASDLLKTSGSLTAALDNIMILLNKGFNARAANLAVNLLEMLGRWDDALELWERLDTNGIADQETGARIEFHTLRMKHYAKPEDEHAALVDFIKRHPVYSPAYERLAALHHELGSPLEAAQALIKGAKSAKSIELYRQAIDLFIDRLGDGQKAIAAARSTMAVLPKESHIAARLLLIAVYIRLEETKDATEAFRDLKNFCLSQQLTMGNQDLLVHLCLQGMLLGLQGRDHESRLLWREVLRELLRPGSTDSTYDHIDGTACLPEVGQDATPSPQYL